MDHEIEPAPLLLDLVEHGVDAGQIAHVARRNDFRTKRLSKRNGAAAECVTLIREGEFGALSGQNPRNAPGDRAVIRDPHDEAALASHQWTGNCDIVFGHGTPLRCAGTGGMNSKQGQLSKRYARKRCPKHRLGS